MGEQVLRGRAVELTAALTVLRQAQHTGQGAMLLVSGEAGMGKTALLRNVCRQAGRLGYDVGVGRAEDSDQITPMACVLLALRSGRAPLLPREVFAALAPIQHQRLWVIDAVVEELERLASLRPVLICIDDVQWADHASAFALGVLPGRLAGSPVVWLIATRPGTTTAEDILQAASRDVSIERIALRALDPVAIEQLASDRLLDRIDSRVRHLLRGADGVPFLAVALLDGLAARLPDDRRTPPTAIPPDGEELPDSLVLGIRARLESLPARSVRLVQIGAVLGRSFTVTDAAALLGGSPAEVVLPWLEPAVRAGVLEDTGEQIVFRHDLLRQAVYADQLPSARRALHRSAAVHMLDAGRSALDAAAHLMRSATVGDLDAVEVLRRAATMSADAAPATAAELALHAFSLLTPSEVVWGACGLQAVALLEAVDRDTDAVAVAEALLKHELDDELAAHIQIEVARSMWNRGDLEHMRQRVDAAGQLTGLTEGMRARLLALRALSHSQDVDAEAAVADAEEALITGERSQDRQAQISALHALGQIARNDGRNDAALGLFRRMRQVAGIGFVHDEVLSLQLLDRFDESAAILTEAEGRAREAGWSANPADVSFGLMWQGFTLGDLDETETHAHSLMRVGDELKQYSLHSEARALLCRVAQLRGDLDGAREQLSQARTHVAQDDSKELLLTVVEAWLSHAEGNDDRALAATRALLRPVRAVRHRWLWQPGWLLPGLQIAMGAGDVDLARDITSLTQDLHRRNPAVPTNAALAACALGVTTGSIDSLVRAREIARTSRRLVTRGQITTLLGQALLRDERRAEGVAVLDDAWDLYTTMGAHGEARSVQQLLQVAGVRRRRWAVTKARPVDGWDALTSSEQRVARLIASGHTNRSAAQELVLSPNTIATHLRSVFLKLGVNSRVQLSLAVAETAKAG